MVTFIPPYMGEEIKSNAEKKMYDVLQELHMEDAYILHSLGLPKHQNKIYGRTRVLNLAAPHSSVVEKEMATHSSVLAWRIPWTEEPVGLPSMGSHRVGHD